MKEITDAFGYWFSGFADGESCFHIGKDKRNTLCASYRCSFEITLRNDDEPLLERIRKALGLGKLFAKPVYPGSSPNAQPQATFLVQSINGCAVLVRVFEKYPLQSKKRCDFAIWKQAVVELAKPVKCRDVELLEYLFLKIKEVRKYEEQAELVKPKKIELQLTIEF